jgi:hypothetical protein
LRRLLEEDEGLTIEEAAMAASCRSALGGASHDEAYGMLAAMAERATRQRGRSPRSVLTGPASRGKRSSGRREVERRAGPLRSAELEQGGATAIF